MGAIRHGVMPPRRDPRGYQIGALLFLVLYGWIGLRFDLSIGQAAVTLAVTLGVQLACTWYWKLPAFDLCSALISGLSLCLLLRTNSLWLAAATAAAAIGSKFVLRWNRKHLFNPTNFGLVFLMLCTDGKIWVSPGQWGAVAFFGFLMICVGGLVVYRAERADVTVAFLFSYLGLVFGRSLWLGEPMAIPLHRLQGGALLLFAFFMISDPKTTPDSRAGRIIFALLVAIGAAFVQFRLFRTNGLLWSLAICALTVPLFDWLLPGPRYDWRPKSSTRIPKPEPEKEIVYEPVLT